MSLVSATRIVGGLREYTYRGFQQLPIVIGSTSLLFTIATGSVAHGNIALGMGALMPAYTFALQTLITIIMNSEFMQSRFPNSVFWKRISSDSCKILPDFSKANKLSYYVPDKGFEYEGSVPSYWLMSIAFFIGYCISNAVDCLETPAESGSNEINYEKRNHHATLVIVTTVLFSFLLIICRLYFMPGCEGVNLSGDRLIPTAVSSGILLLLTIILSIYTVIKKQSMATWAVPLFVFGSFILSYYLGGMGILLSLLAAFVAGSIGHGMYSLSKRCGARSSDLFGILSQILPLSATTPKPVVCMADDS
jgi:hypothetical protein